jgi:hypothetical protein
LDRIFFLIDAAKFVNPSEHMLWKSDHNRSAVLKG